MFFFFWGGGGSCILIFILVRGGRRWAFGFWCFGAFSALRDFLGGFRLKGFRFTRGALLALNPKPLNPTPYTLNPKPYIRRFAGSQGPVPTASQAAALEVAPSELLGAFEGSPAPPHPVIREHASKHTLNLKP